MSDVTIGRQEIARRGRRLEYFTIAWNTLEGLIGVGAGLLAGSISLIGFGTDSFIEVISGATLLWRMSVDEDAGRRERSEKLSLRIVGVCLIALAIYIAYEAISDLARKTAPEHSIPGIVLACVSLFVMPILPPSQNRIEYETDEQDRREIDSALNAKEPAPQARNCRLETVQEFQVRGQEAVETVENFHGLLHSFTFVALGTDVS